MGLPGHSSARRYSFLSPYKRVRLLCSFALRLRHYWCAVLPAYAPAMPRTDAATQYPYEMPSTDTTVWYYQATAELTGATSTRNQLSNG
eukprot:3937198-Rhodomonas_salina.2